MTRPEFFGPGGELSDYDLHCVLLLASVNVPLQAITPWTAMERLLAYDWAMREHLIASDNLVRRRECPSFVVAADIGLSGDGGHA